MAELNSNYIHIRNYQLNLEPICRGYHGIFQGTDINTGEVVAVKKVKKDHLVSRLAFKEIEIMQMLNGCTNIVKLLNFFDDESYLWLIMEFCNLQDLTQYLRNPTIDVNAKMRLMLDVSTGLAHMHDMTPKVVHRDIKPANILLKLQDGRPVAKLGGFCWSKPFNSDTKNFAMDDDVGTTFYKAPELFLLLGTLVYYPSVDIFALGMVFTYMLMYDQYGDDPPWSVAVRKSNKFLPYGLEIKTAIENKSKMPELFVMRDTDSPHLTRIQEIITQMTQYHEKDRPSPQQVKTQLQQAYWSLVSEEKKRLAEMHVLRVLYIGESNAGKTSLAQTILQNKPYLTEKKDRTVVADHFLWMPDEAPGSVFAFVDIGGHSSYQVSGHYFHCNSDNNLSVFCHDLSSKQSDKTFRWVESTINRSLRCEILFLLTKADTKNACIVENIDHKKKEFTRELEKFLDKKISGLKKSVVSAQKCTSSKINMLAKLLEKYEDLRSSYQDKLLVTSCYNENKVVRFKESLITVSKRHKVMLTKPLQLLFAKIGKRSIPIKQFHKDKQTTLQSKAQSRSQAPHKLQAKAENFKAGSNDAHESVDEDNLSEDNEWQAFGCNLEEMKYIRMQDILSLYQDILESLSLSTENIEEVLKDGLDELHKNGLLMFFRGEPYLEDIIFHDMNVFVSVIKCVFHHRTDDFLTEKQDDQQFNRLLTKHYSDNLTKFQNDKGQLYKQGLMSSAMLQFLLGMNDCDLDYRAVRQLLIKLEEAAFAMDNMDEESDIFVPYFVEELQSSQSLEQIRRFERDTLVVQCDIRGNNLPITLWHYLLIKVLKKLNIPLQKREVWKNGMSAHTGRSKGKILFLFNGEDRIGVFMQAEIKEQVGHAHIWEFIESIQEETDRLMKDWWPGLVTEKIIRCTDLVVGSEPCEGHDLETVMSMEGDTYCCGGVTDIPIALIQPLGKGAEKKLTEAQAYINARVEPSTMLPKNEVSLERRVKRLETKILRYEDYSFRLPQIRKHLDKLVEGLVAHEVLDYLFQESMLSDEDYEDIKAYDSTPRKQTRMLLCKVDERGQQALQVLISAVREQPQLKHLLKYLEDKTQGARRK